MQCLHKKYNASKKLSQKSSISRAARDILLTCAEICFIYGKTSRALRYDISASVSCSYVGVSLAGLYNAKTYSFWGGAPDPDGGAYSTPPYPLAGLVWVTTVQPDRSLYRGAGPVL